MISKSDIAALSAPQLCGMFEVDFSEIQKATSAGFEESHASQMVVVRNEIAGNFGSDVSLPSVLQLCQLDLLVLRESERKGDAHLEILAGAVDSLHEAYIGYCERHEISDPTPEDTVTKALELGAAEKAKTLDAVLAIFNGTRGAEGARAARAVKAAPASVPVEESAADVSGDPDRENALAVIAELPAGVRERLGLARSTLTAAIIRYGLDDRQLADIAHLNADRSVSPGTYLALREQGLDHDQLITTSNLSTAFDGQGTEESDFQIRELIDTRRMDPEDIEALEDDPNIVSIEVLLQFAEQFGFDQEDLLDDNCACANALLEIRQIIDDQPLDLILPQVVALSETTKSREFEVVLAKLRGSMHLSRRGDELLSDDGADLEEDDSFLEG